MSEKFKINAIWIIVDLVLVIVWLAATNWARIPGLTELFSFSLTLASLILAGVAIVYGFVWNESLARTAEGIAGTTAALDAQLSRLPTEFERTQKRTADKIDELTESLGKKSIEIQEAPRGARPGEGIAEVTTSLVNQFERYMSPNGNWVLYASHLSNVTRKAFNLGELSGQIGVLDPSYAHGILVASSCAGILSFQFDKGIVTVSSFDEELGKRAKRMSDKADATIAEKVKEDPYPRTPRIESYFGLPEAPPPVPAVPVPPPEEKD